MLTSRPEGLRITWCFSLAEKRVTEELVCAGSGDRTQPDVTNGVVCALSAGASYCREQTGSVRDLVYFRSSPFFLSFFFGDVVHDVRR